MTMQRMTPLEIAKAQLAWAQAKGESEVTLLTETLGELLSMVAILADEDRPE